MRNFFLTIILLVAAIKFGSDYVFSEKFQAYADKTKAPWTCTATLYMGHIFQLMDNPQRAKTYYDRIPSRCQGLTIESEAAYYSAYSIDQMDIVQPSVEAYSHFLVQYSTSPRVDDVQKALNRIRGTKSL